MSGSLDANVLLRLIINDIPDQTLRANQLIDNGGEFRISIIAIVETMFVLERNYKAARQQISDSIQFFMKHPQILMDNELFTQSLILYKNSPALSGEDCCMAVQAKLSGAIPLWTFDKKIANQSKGLAIEIEN